jgi:hypothetical protein
MAAKKSSLKRCPMSWHVCLMMAMLPMFGLVYAGPEASAPEKIPAAQERDAPTNDAAPKEILDEKLLQEIRRRRARMREQSKSSRPAPVSVPVSFQFADTSVTEVARIYADFAANDQVLVSTRVSELRISVRGENVPAAEVIRRIEETLAGAGVEVVHLISGTVAFMAFPVVDAK